MTDLMHWRYFLALESDLEATSRYVEFEPANMQTYSIEFLRLLLAAGSECDVLLKAIASKYANLPERPNMGHYREHIGNRFPLFHTIFVNVPRYQIRLTPFRFWKDGRPGDSVIGQPVSWWDAYTQAKHHRDRAYTAATLQYAMDAVAGVMVCALALHAVENTLNWIPSSELPKLLETSAMPAFLVTCGFGLPEVTEALKPT